jgi:hypothetical protein
MKNNQNYIEVSEKSRVEYVCAYCVPIMIEGQFQIFQRFPVVNSKLVLTKNH